MQRVYSYNPGAHTGQITLVEVMRIEMKNELSGSPHLEKLHVLWYSTQLTSCPKIITDGGERGKEEAVRQNEH